MAQVSIRPPRGSLRRAFQRESRAFWMELGAALVLKRAARPAWVVCRCSLTCTLTRQRAHHKEQTGSASQLHVCISQGRVHEDEICKETSAESTCRWREGASNSIARAPASWHMNYRADAKRTEEGRTMSGDGRSTAFSPARVPYCMRAGSDVRSGAHWRCPVLVAEKVRKNSTPRDSHHEFGNEKKRKSGCFWILGLTTDRRTLLGRVLFMGVC